MLATFKQAREQLAFSFGLDGHLAADDGVDAISRLDVFMTRVCIVVLVVLVALFPHVIRLVGHIRSLLTRVDSLEDAAILHGVVRLRMELAGSLQCFGVVVLVVSTSAALFHSIDLAVVFPSALAPVIVAAVAPLITLIPVVAGVVALVAAVKIVVPTTIATVIVAVWGVVGAWNPCCFFNDYLFSVVSVRIFLSGGQKRCDRFGSLPEELVS